VSRLEIGGLKRMCVEGNRERDKNTLFVCFVKTIFKSQTLMLQLSMSQWCDEGLDGDVDDEDSIMLKAPGTKYFIDKLMSQLNANVIKLNTKVTAINYGQSGTVMQNIYPHVQMYQ
jgi:hypothetical protein